MNTNGPSIFATIDKVKEENENTLLYKSALDLTSLNGKRMRASSPTKAASSPRKLTAEQVEIDSLRAKVVALEAALFSDIDSSKQIE